MYFIPTTAGKSAAKRLIQPGVEAWMGFYIACRQMEDGDPVINFGMTHKFFMSLSLSLLDFYRALINDSLSENRPKIVLTEDSVMSAQGIAHFTEKLTGLKMKCEWVPEKDRDGNVVGRVERHPRFIKAMKTTESADNYFMMVFDPVRRTRNKVRMDQWYYEQGQKLNFPKLPLCEVKLGAKTEYLPMEVLFTHDKPQKFTKLLDPYARMRIPQILSKTPQFHQKLTTEMVANKMEYQSDPYLEAMKVDLDKTMVECTGRVLNKTGINTRDDSGKVTSERMNAETGEFPVKRAYETTEKETIFVVCRATSRISEENVTAFYRGLVEKCKSRGMRVSKKEIFRNAEPLAVASMIEEVLGYVEQRTTKEEILVFLFFIGNTDEQLYGEIKLLSDLYHGVVTQIITESTVIKLRANAPDTDMTDYKTVFHNIWLKLNVKLGGVNQIVDFSESNEPQHPRLPSHERTMFIGIDVIHPSPNSPLRSFSIAAIVGSTDKNATKLIQPGVEAWMGFYIACRQMEDGDPVINFGMTHKFFMSLSLSLLDFYRALINDSLSENRPKIVLTEDSVMSAQGIAHFTEKLTGLKMKCEWVPEKDRDGNVVGRVERHPRFIKAMKTTESADNYFMMVFDPVRRTRNKVRMDQWYYEQGQKLNFPKLPLCEVKLGAKTEYLPMEVLFTHDKPQKFTKLLDPYARMRIPQILSKTPQFHQKLTTEMVANKMEYQSDPYLEAMKVDLDKTMVECTGRVLNKTGINTRDDSGKVTSERMNAETGEFPVKRAYETTEKETIFVVCRATSRISEENVTAFYRGLVEKCKSRGMRVSKKEIFRNAEPLAVASMIEEVLGYVEQRTTKEEILVFLFFIGNTDEQLYGEIKLLSDLYHGVVTQIITESTVIKLRANAPDTDMTDYKTVFHNIWLKLNVKLGGVNQIVDFSESNEPQHPRLPSHERTMFIGIDVIHPSPNSPLRSFSIAAIVGSTDKNATKYADRIMVNRNCNETVQHFQYHFSLLLKEYVMEQKKRAVSDPKNLTDLLPERVVILRDGVSDSEMILAASRELQSIKEACNTSANGAPLPPFTYIVVQKRHKTRFYRRDVTENNANPFPGTVVTEGAVSPHKFDFYMISHHTPEGTSRPAHYTVVVDESHFSTDEVTEMCFRLCCLYSRCSQPVSIPTPVYYAHLRCKRAAVQFLAAINSEPPQLAEIEDIGPRETEQQYKERVDKHAFKIEQLLNRDFNVPKKYPGMHFV